MKDLKTITNNFLKKQQKKKEKLFKTYLKYYETIIFRQCKKGAKKGHLRNHYNYRVDMMKTIPHDYFWEFMSCLQARLEEHNDMKVYCWAGNLVCDWGEGEQK